MRSENRSLYLDISIVTLAAFAVRLVYDLEIKSADPTFTYPLMDARWHVQWAMGIAQGITGEDVFFRAPLYPYFLGMLFKLLGPDFLVVRIIQAALGALTAALACLLGRRLGGRWVGVVGGVIAAFYGPMVYFDGEFLIPTLFIPLILSGLVLALWALEKNRMVLWALAGLTMGIASTARPNVLVFAPVFIAWAAWEMRSKFVACSCTRASSLD